MPFDTYDNLQSAIADWLVKRNLTDRIKDFIALGEARFDRDVNVLTETYSIKNSAFLSISTAPFALPSYINAVKTIWNTSLPNLDEIPIVGPAEWRNLVHRYSGTSGVPIAASISDNPDDWTLRLNLVPSPASAMSIDLEYVRNLTPLSDVNQTNPILTRYPDLYLYAALAESAPFLQHDERVAVWETRYAAIVASINADSARRRLGGGSHRGYFTAK